MWVCSVLNGSEQDDGAVKIWHNWLQYQKTVIGLGFCTAWGIGLCLHTMKKLVLS